MEQKRTTHEEWVGWVQKVTAGASARAIGKQLGISHTTVSRWLREGATEKAVIAISVGYGAPVVSGLVEMGFLSAEDAGRMNVSDVLKTIPNVLLAAEIHRRAVVFKRIYGKDTVD